jgi:ATP-dependent DNA helicase RecQ
MHCVHPDPPPSVPDPLLEAAAPFGVSYLFPYQRLVITNVLEDSEDSVTRQIVVLPTGAGKTLCFQLPAAVLEGVTIVVYPLLSLMADQLRRAEAAGLGAVVIGGGQTRAEQEDIFRRMTAGEIRIVLTNPETLSQEPVLDRLSGFEISHLVIDEAHCVSEWGETFRPAYLELGRVITALAPRTTTGFTATASPPVLDAMRSHLFGDDGAHLIQAVPDRPNISYSVLKAPAMEFALRALLAGQSAGACEPVANERSAAPGATVDAGRTGALALPALVFCRSRKRVEDVARNLAGTLGWDRVGAYHAGLSKEERTAIEQWFFSADDAVLVATCAYGTP